jgi:quinol monooxygenase YgiN
MIVLAGTMRILSEDRAMVLKTMEELQDKSLSDKGVVAYHFSIDLKDENLIHVYEEWDSTANLKVHGQQEHMDPFRALRHDKKIEIVRFSRWRAEELGEY